MFLDILLLTIRLKIYLQFSDNFLSFNYCTLPIFVQILRLILEQSWWILQLNKRYYEIITGVTFYTVHISVVL